MAGVTLGYFFATLTPTLQNPLPLGRVRVLRGMGKGIKGYGEYTMPPHNPLVAAYYYINVSVSGVSS